MIVRDSCAALAVLCAALCACGGTVYLERSSDGAQGECRSSWGHWLGLARTDAELRRCVTEHLREGYAVRGSALDSRASASPAPPRAAGLAGTPLSREEPAPITRPGAATPLRPGARSSALPAGDVRGERAAPPPEGDGAAGAEPPGEAERRMELAVLDAQIQSRLRSLEQRLGPEEARALGPTLRSLVKLALASARDRELELARRRVMEKSRGLSLRSDARRELDGLLRDCSERGKLAPSLRP